MPGTKPSQGSGADHGQPGDPPRRRPRPPARPADEDPRQRRAVDAAVRGRRRVQRERAPKIEGAGGTVSVLEVPTDAAPALGVDDRPARRPRGRGAASHGRSRPRAPGELRGRRRRRGRGRDRRGPQGRPPTPPRPRPRGTAGRRPPMAADAERPRQAARPRKPKPSPTRTRSRPCSSRCSTRSARRTSGAGSSSSSGSWSSTAPRPGAPAGHRSGGARGVLPQQRRVRDPRPLRGRRAVVAVDRRPGDEPVHQRLDHHAADDGRDPVAPGAEPRGRVRPQEAQPVHPLPDGPDGAPPGVRHPVGRSPRRT